MTGARSPSTERAGAARSLREQAASGAKWTFGAGALTALAQFIQIAVVAQFLDPSDLGLAAIVTVVVGFAYAFTDMGLSNAIISKQASGPQLSSLYWLNIIAGVVLAAVVLAVSPVLADLYGEPELGSLLPIASLAFLITPLGQQFQALLQKDLEFAPIAIADGSAAVIGASVAVSLAASGAGAGSLVWGLVALATVRAMVLAIRGWTIWRPRFRFRRSDLRGYLGFGLFQMGERSVNYLAANVDYLLIGYFLGPGPLGAYTLAYQITARPQAQINPVLTRVAFPVFARRQEDDAALRRGYIELTRTLSLINFPFLVGVAVVAPDLVPAVFGDRWSEAVPVIQILAVLGALKSLGAPTSAVYLAKRRPDIGFAVNVLLLIAVIALIRLGVEAGIEGAAWGHVAAVMLVSGVNRSVMKLLIGLGFLELFAALRRPVLMAVAMGLTVLALSPVIHELVPGGLAALVVEIVAGIAAYGVLLAAFDRAEVVRLWRLMRGSGVNATVPLGAASGSRR